jgi:hypothetical protein
MRLLLDECVPQRLSQQLQEFEVSHVGSEGWAGRRNGDLLRAMRIAGFDVLVTVDRTLVYQQNVASAGIAVIVLHAHGNRVRDLLPLLPELRESAARIKSGEIVHLGG